MHAVGGELLCVEQMAAEQFSQNLRVKTGLLQNLAQFIKGV